MAVEPDIALGYNPGGGVQQINPLASLGQLAEVQNSLNKNRLFQQSMAARMKFGQMIATADSPEDAIAQGMKDPLVAGFAPEMMQNMASLQQTLQSNKGLIQDQTGKGLESFLTMLPEAAQDPGMIDKVIEQAAATMPDGPAKENALRGMTNIKSGLTANYDPSDPASLVKYDQQLTGLLTHYGASAQDVASPDGSTHPVVRIGPVAVNLQGAGTAPAGSEGTNPGAGTASGGAQFGTPSTTQGTEFQNQAAQVNTMEQGFNSQAESLPLNINRLQNVAKALTKFQAGAGENARMGIAQVIQGLSDLGIQPGIMETIRKQLGPDDLKNAQLFQQEVANLALQNLGQVQKGLGEASAAELNNAISQFSVTKDPGMLQQALDFADQGLRQQQDKITQWMDYKKTVGNDPAKLIDFPKVYMQSFMKNGIQTPSNMPKEGPLASQPQYVGGSKFPEGRIVKNNKTGALFLIQNGQKIPYHGSQAQPGGREGSGGSHGE